MRQDSGPHFGNNSHEGLYLLTILFCMDNYVHLHGFKNCADYPLNLYLQQNFPSFKLVFFLLVVLKTDTQIHHGHLWILNLCTSSPTPSYLGEGKLVLLYSREGQLSLLYSGLQLTE